MTKQIDLNKYTDFVNKVTSDESNHLSSMIDKLATIDNVNIS